MKEVSCVIIGGGIGGMACALTLARLGISDVVLMEKAGYLGGLLNQNIHLGYGKQMFKKDLSGPLFAQNYEQLLKRTRVEIMNNCFVYRIDEMKRVYYIDEKGYGSLHCRCIVLACGGMERSYWLMDGGMRGIYSALSAQRLVNLEGIRLGNRILILGGGDTACILARRFSYEGMEVVGICEKMEEGSADERLRIQCIDEFAIPYYNNCEIVGLKGDHRLKGVCLSNGIEIACDTLVVATGMVVNLKLLAPLMHDFYHIEVDEGYQSQLSGFFICGNSLHIHHDVDGVIAQACRCADGVAAYLSDEAEDDVVFVEFSDDFDFVYPQRIHRRHLKDFQLFVKISQPKAREIMIEADQQLIQTVRINRWNERGVEIVNCSLHNESLSRISLSLGGTG